MRHEEQLNILGLLVNFKSKHIWLLVRDIRALETEVTKKNPPPTMLII